NGTVDPYATTESVGNGLSVGAIQIQNPQGTITIAGNLGNATANVTLAGLPTGFQTGPLSDTSTPIGIDMSNSTQNLTITSNVVLGATQQWVSGTSTVLNVSGIIS